MNKIISFSKDKFNLPTIIILIGICLGLCHIFSYLVPLTDDAFVVANNQAVAADVSGYITEIFVKNGEKVKKGQPLFKVFDKPYQLAFQKAQANYEEAIANLAVIKEESQKNSKTLTATEEEFAKIKYEYTLKSNSQLNKSVSRLELEKLSYDLKAKKAQTNSLKNQLAIDDKQLLQQQKRIAAFKAEMDSAQMNLDLTTVYASSDGVIDNMYLAKGTPIIAHQPLFSFINTSDWYVQANFNETDLRHVRPNDDAIIILRMYYFDKVFHGKIVNTLWATDRQTSVAKTQQQTISNNNEWLRLPQRFPLQIKINDPDPKFPLNPGSSAYVYIKTH